MNTIKNILDFQIEKYKKGEIKQGELLKSLFPQIKNMLSMKMTAKTQVDFLKQEFEIEIEPTNFAIWLSRNKKKILAHADFSSAKADEKSAKNPKYKQEGSQKKSDSDVKKTEESKEIENDVFKNLKG